MTKKDVENVVVVFEMIAVIVSTAGIRKKLVDHESRSRYVCSRNVR